MNKMGLIKKRRMRRSVRNLFEMVVESLKKKGATIYDGFEDYKGNPVAPGNFHIGRLEIRTREYALETLLYLPGHTQLEQELQTKAKQKYKYGGHNVIMDDKINSVNPDEIAHDLCEAILYYERIQKETAEIGKEIENKIRETIEKY